MFADYNFEDIPCDLKNAMIKTEKAKQFSAIVSQMEAIQKIQAFSDPIDALKALCILLGDTPEEIKTKVDTVSKVFSKLEK